MEKKFKRTIGIIFKGKEYIVEFPIIEDFSKIFEEKFKEMRKDILFKKKIDKFVEQNHKSAFGSIKPDCYIESQKCRNCLYLIKVSKN